ncbi:MAG: permease-like cell division protein FtsX [Porticoccaceae bacterium]
MTGNRRAATPRPNPPARSGGAGENRGRSAHPIASYLRDHGRNSRESLRRLVSMPVQTAMAAVVIAIALALPAGLYVGVASIRQLSDHFRSSAQVSVFLHRDAPARGIEQLIGRIRALPDVNGVVYVSREAALREFKTNSGFADALALLDENPLPPVLLVTPREMLEHDAVRVEQLVDYLQGDPLVDAVQLDMKWLQRMRGLLAIGGQVVLSLGIGLALGVILVVGNTIGLAIENRRDEVLVTKLVGGTNAFVRRPFLYTGFWYGVLGGAIAWIGLTLGQLWLGETVAKLGALYQTQFALAELGLRGLLLPLSGAVLGLAGAWLAVSRHLALIEPR